MAIEVKDLAEILGLKVDDKTTAEDAKTFLDEKFVSREHAPKDDKIIAAIFGKRVGEIRTKVKQLGEFDAKELDALEPIQLIEKLNEKFTSQLTAAQEAAKGGKDKQVTDLEKLIEDKDKSLKAYKEGLKEKEEKINELTTTYTDGLKTYKTNHKLDELKSKIPFVEDYSKKEVLRTGFEALLKTKAKFSLNDKDELEVYSSDGNPIKHPKKTGEFLKPDEFLLQLAEEQGLIKKNNGQQEKQKLFIPGYTEKYENGQQPKSKVHAKARANAERVN